MNTQPAVDAADEVPSDSTALPAQGQPHETPGAETRDAEHAAVPGEPQPATGWDSEPAGQQTAGQFAGLADAVRLLADSAAKYHARAEQREGVISQLHAEVDRLRRGERRGLLRPLLAELCRLRNDLLRQAEDLPADFDAERARCLLRSYAESVELALEDSGVVIFTPQEGDRFDPRTHRRVGGAPTSDPALAGRVLRVLRSGYLDIEANGPIAPAEVVLFTLAAAETAAATASAAGAGTDAGTGQAERPVTQPDPEARGPGQYHPASVNDERTEL